MHKFLCQIMHTKWYVIQDKSSSECKDLLDHVPLRVHDLAQELVHVQYLWPTALLHNMTSKARCPKWWLLPAEEVEKAKHCCFSQESATVQSGCLRDWSTKISAGKRVYQSATRTTVFHGNILASPENRRIQPVLICSNVMKCLMRLSGQGSLRNILDTFTVGLYLKQPAAMLIYHHVAGCVVFHNSKYPLHCSCLMMAFPCKSIYDYIYIYIYSGLWEKQWTTLWSESEFSSSTTDHCFCHCPLVSVQPSAHLTQRARDPLFPPAAKQCTLLVGGPTDKNSQMICNDIFLDLQFLGCTELQWLDLIAPHVSRFPTPTYFTSSRPFIFR